MSDPEQVSELLKLSVGAVIHAADLHVHTPASADMKSEWKTATPDALVKLALEKGLSVIAVTDHNSADWCDRVTEAAAGTLLHVFPGVELSTKHGHLLAIFEKATAADIIREFLVAAGIPAARQGNLNAASPKDMNELAQMVEDRGGVAIAAHVESNNGLMKFGVDDERRRVYSSRYIRGVEIADPARRTKFQEGRRPGYSRRVACLMSSDCVHPGGDPHDLDAIGSRLSFLKMDEVSISGLKQALCDPEVRIRLPGDQRDQPDSAIEGLWVSGGFLDGQLFRFNDNLTCLIGATGSGKSLTTELVRFALDQQASIGKIATEVESLLRSTFRGLGQVSVVVRKGDSRYLVERAYDGTEALAPVVRRIEDGALIDIEETIDLPSFFPIKAYSQSEIIEFARDKEARLSLTDDLIDITNELADIALLKAGLRTNATALVELDRRLAQAEQDLGELGSLRTDIERVEKVLNHARVKEHEKWQTEKRALASAQDKLASLGESAADAFPALDGALLPVVSGETPNLDLIAEVQALETGLRTDLDGGRTALEKALSERNEEFRKIETRWKARFAKEETAYEKLLKTIDSEKRGLPALARRLTALQDKEAKLLRMQEDVATTLRPRRDRTIEAREKLLTDLQSARRTIHQKRRAKAAELTNALERRVMIKVVHTANGIYLQKALDELKVGSRIGNDDIGTMASKLHPVRFVKSLLARDFAALEEASGVSAATFERLAANIVDRGHLRELYDLQLVDVDDVVDIRFKVADGEYRELEKLAHGQKCTVVLMVAMAEGDFPLVVDQPEDALHAPYIEGNIVATLRSQRGRRQYIFATRNANVLVSGDAEQIIVMEADASAAQVQRAGSIDRFTTRDLVLLHLEGGKEAFERKQLKYSLDAPAS